MSTPTKPPELLIIGAGVLALTTATLLQSLHPSTPVTLIASEFPSPSPITPSQPGSTSKPTPSYASMWAGAHYRPIPFIPSTHTSFSTLSPQTQKFHLQLAREREWALITSNRMKALARCTPEAGVQIVDGEEYLEDPPLQNLLLRSGDVYAGVDDGFRVWEGKEVEESNERLKVPSGRGISVNEEGSDSDASTGNVKWASTYETYIVNPHIYTAYLLSKFTQNGGRTIQQKLGRLTDALVYAQPQSSPKQTSTSPRTPIVIINCSGTGLTADSSTTPIRGQTLLLRAPYHKTVTRQCKDGTWSFLIPRPLDGGTVIGGTKQIGDTHGAARPEERRRLLENAARYFPEFLGGKNLDGEEMEGEIVCDNVGFRPGREGGVRVEREDVKIGDGHEAVSIVHGYGAGGRGYEISWGVAGEVCELVGACLRGLSGGEEKAKL